MFDISWWRTSFGGTEVDRLSEAIAGEHISQGPITAEFERELGDFLESYVVATTSGSMALLLALMAAGVGPGDEVIVPNRTWIATAHAPLLLGARVVLADVERDRPILDVTQIEAKITPRTKAVMPVHLNGRSVRMDEVNRIASTHGLQVIEDAAQALGSKNASGLLGTQSDAGCFSLSVAKIISTGQGGFVVTGNSKLYERLKLIRGHGVADVINATYTIPGFNFRFTDIQASIGRAQLKCLSERIERVKAIYSKYATALADLPYLKLVPVDIEAGEVPIYVEVLCPVRERLVRFMADKGIETRPFYPDLDAAGYFGPQGVFPNSRVFGQEGLFLPSGPDQRMKNIEIVIEVLRLFGEEAGGSATIMESWEA